MSPEGADYPVLQDQANEAVKKSSCRGGPCGRPARAGATIPRLQDPYDATA